MQCKFTDLNVQNYFGIELTTTALSTAEECVTADNPQANWELVDIELYEQHRYTNHYTNDNLCIVALWVSLL